jgi:hypothetical protein
MGVDGWYIFDGKRIRGPVTDDELGDLHDDPVQRRRLQVSREGFRRWYTLEEIGRMLSLSRRPVQDSLQSEILEFKRQFDSRIAQLESLERSFAVESKLRPEAEDFSEGSFKILGDDEAEFSPPPKQAKRDPKVRRDSITTQRKERMPNDHFETMLAEATLKGLQQSSDGRSEEMSTDDVDELEALFDRERTHAEIPEEQPAPERSSPASIPDFNSDYVVLKGRLRLGANRSAIAAALTSVITLGIGTWTWYRNAALESAYHLTSNYRRMVPPYFLVLIPIVHFVMFYQLAMVISAMEKQNNYQVTSPLVAVILAIFPPAAIHYLQERMNQHWQLHVHSVRAEQHQPA